MSRIFYIIFILLNFHSLISNEQFINNPVPMPNHSNIVNYTFILEYKNEQNAVGENESQQVFLQPNLEKILNESYIFGSNFFICTDLLNNNFLLINQKYFVMAKKSEKYSFSYKKDLNHDYIYIGYFARKVINDNKERNQVILYGIKDIYYLCFFNVNLNNTNKICLNFGNYNGYVSCKDIENRLSVCAYSIDNKLNLIFFNLLFDNNEPNIILTKEYTDNQIKDIIVPYDTAVQKFKILCARKKIIPKLNALKWVSLMFLIMVDKNQ